MVIVSCKNYLKLLPSSVVVGLHFGAHGAEVHGTLHNIKVPGSLQNNEQSPQMKILGKHLQAEGRTYHSLCDWIAEDVEGILPLHFVHNPLKYRV